VEENETQPTWSVMFGGDYAVVVVTVEALTNDEATEKARALIQDFYGWDVSRFTVEAEAI
jgi:hypothetical protein